MTQKAQVIFCDNEHGTGDVCFPDLSTMDRFEFRQMMIQCNSVRSLRRDAKAAGWGRVDGVDYCPNCMASQEGGR